MLRNAGHDGSEIELLLTDMDQDGRNHQRLEVSKIPNDACFNLATPKQGLQENHEGLEEDSDSAASFETCPNMESTHCIPAQASNNGDDTKPRERIPDEETLLEAHRVRDPSPHKKKTQSAGENVLESENMPPSTSGVQGLNQTSEWSSSKTDSHPAAPLLTPAVSGEEPATDDDEPLPMACLQASDKLSRAAIKAGTLHTTNESVSEDPAELYARFDQLSVQESNADLLGVNGGKAHNQAVALPSKPQASEGTEEVQCRFCELYFMPEQIAHELDNGIKSCSFHPG